MNPCTTSSSMELNPSSPIICSSTTDIGALNYLNDPDLEKSPNNILPKHQMGFFNVQDLHMLATANLIAQTQETIAQQFNITVDPHLKKEKKTKSSEKLVESGSRSSQGMVKRPVSKSKSDNSAKRFCVEQLNIDTRKEIKTAEAKDIKTDIQVAAEHFCKDCNQKFSSAAKLKTHFRTHKPLECQHPGCNKKFMWPSHFKYHQLTHAGERKFKCDSVDCGQLFYTAQQLEVQQRTHDNNKPFTCPHGYCVRSFTTAGNLKNHMRCHTGEKPFACDYPQCDKKFAELSTLKKHKITHTGQKPYLCELCGKSFTQSSSRSVHMKSHRAASMLMFFCEFCSQTFTQRKALREHVETVHPQEECNILREHLTANQVTECVVKNGSSGEASHIASLNDDELTCANEELAAHIKVAVSSPNGNVCIVVLPSGHDNGLKSVKHTERGDLMIQR